MKTLTEKRLHGGYALPDKWGYRTLEEFLDINMIDEASVKSSNKTTGCRFRFRSKNFKS